MELRTYQIENAQKLAQIIHRYNIAYFAAEPRTGKTITAFQTCVNVGAKNVLFVTKKKAITSIENDSKHYPDLNVEIINFESVLKKAGNYDIVIVDEAHSIGAFPKPSKRAVDIKKIVGNKRVLYLSGTPTPESHSQIYHQLYVSIYSPFAHFKNFYGFASQFVNKKTKHVFNREIPDYSDCRSDELMKYCGHLFLDYTQKEAGFEVSISEKFIRVPMNEIQKTIINNILKDSLHEITENAVILADTAVKMQNKIHQVCSGTVIDELKTVHIVSDVKALAIKDIFKGQRIAIFYKFNGELDVLKAVFYEEHTNLPEEFQSGLKRVFLGQFVSSREGIRLDEADAIIFYNIDFSYLSYAQSKDRIISKERTKEAVLYWCFSVGGIEEKIYKAVSKKKNFTSYYFKKDYNVRKQVRAENQPQIRG